MYGNFNPYYVPTQNIAQPTQQTSNNGLIWVQGESGAKSYIVPQGQSALLMDSEGSVFYIKSTDASGMPLPLRKYKYEEITNNAQNSSNLDFSIDIDKYVTKEELEQKLAELREIKNG